MKSIFYSIHKENFVSRIYGLFPYINLDDGFLHKATDNNDGCYNQIVENIIMPKTYSFTLDNHSITLYKGYDYSYKELMNYYYKIKGVKNDFTDFIERGIGKKDISIVDFPHDVYPLAPDSIYLIHAKKLYTNMLNIKKTCDLYINSIQQGMEKDEHLCCLCDKFDKMGGVKMMSFLEACIKEAQDIANEYYNYCKTGNLKVTFNISLQNSIKDIGLMSVYKDKWQAGETYQNGDIVIYDEHTYICTQENFGKWDEELEQIVFPYEFFSLIKDSAINQDVIIKGNTDSKLKTLRRYKEFMDAAGISYNPEYGKDWLFYYKVNMVCNYSTLNDDLGNIAFYTDKTDEEKMNLVNTLCDDIYAYGDVITNIYIDEENIKNDIYNIIFEYYIGAHLKAVCKAVKKDEDNNILYYFDDFIYDENDKYHGIKYTDTYTFEKDSEITREFCYYTTDENDKIITVTGVNNEKLKQYTKSAIDNENKKYEFITSNNMQTCNKNINNEISIISSNNAQFESTNNMKDEYQYNRLIRTDSYIGITYEPKKDVDVYISRGNAAAMEKHIKLGEVKTLDDMLSYGNGSFFTIENNSN